jgi:hypothetical protein
MLLPNEVFHAYLRALNREGGMNKFPRVLKNENLVKWEEYLASKKFTITGPVRTYDRA